MKAKALVSSPSRWPAALGVPLYDPAREPKRVERLASVGPIELRIDGGDGPSAIAILE